MRMLNEVEIDLHEALELLAVAAPNRLLVDEDDFWDRNHRLMEKYYPEEPTKQEGKE